MGATMGSTMRWLHCCTRQLKKFPNALIGRNTASRPRKKMARSTSVSSSFFFAERSNAPNATWVAENHSPLHWLNSQFDSQKILPFDEKECRLHMANCVPKPNAITNGSTKAAPNKLPPMPSTSQNGKVKAATVRSSENVSSVCAASARSQSVMSLSRPSEWMHCKLKWSTKLKLYSQLFRRWWVQSELDSNYETRFVAGYQAVRPDTTEYRGHNRQHKNTHLRIVRLRTRGQKFRSKYLHWVW